MAPTREAGTTSTGGASASCGVGGMSGTSECSALSRDGASATVRVSGTGSATPIVSPASIASVVRELSLRARSRSESGARGRRLMPPARPALSPTEISRSAARTRAGGSLTSIVSATRRMASVIAPYLEGSARVMKRTGESLVRSCRVKPALAPSSSRNVPTGPLGSSPLASIWATGSSSPPIASSGSVTSTTAA